MLVFIIIAMIFIGVWHGFTLWETALLKRCLHEKIGISPQYLVFYYKKDSKHVTNLIQAAIDARKKNNAKIIMANTNEVTGDMSLMFDNLDMIVCYTDKNGHFNEIERLVKEDIKHYDLKIFIDSQIQDNCAQHLVDALGLRNYMVEIGFIDEKSRKG